MAKVAHFSDLGTYRRENGYISQCAPTSAIIDSDVTGLANEADSFTRKFNISGDTRLQVMN